MATLTPDNVLRAIDIYERVIGGLPDRHYAALATYWIRHREKRYAVPIVVMVAESDAEGAPEEELIRRCIMREAGYSTGLAAVQKLDGLGFDIEFDHGRDEYRLGNRYCAVVFTNGRPHVRHTHYETIVRDDELVALSDPPRVLARFAFEGPARPGLTLREVINEIGQKYDRSLPQSSDAQRLLRSARPLLQRYVPEGFLVEGSGGRGHGAHVPWIAVFDPDETTSAQDGMYVVYLFSADLEHIALSLNQGVTQLVRRVGSVAGRASC